MTNPTTSASTIAGLKPKDDATWATISLREPVGTPPGVAAACGLMPKPPGGGFGLVVAMLPRGAATVPLTRASATSVTDWIDCDARSHQLLVGMTSGVPTSVGSIGSPHQRNFRASRPSRPSPTSGLTVAVAGAFAAGGTVVGGSCPRGTTAGMGFLSRGPMMARRHFPGPHRRAGFAPGAPPAG